MAGRVVATQAYHASMQRHNRAQHSQQQRNRGTDNKRRRSDEGRGLALLDGPEGAEEGAFLEALKSCIEAKVPSARGQPAGTGGTGGSGEDEILSESDSEANGPLPGVPGRHGGRHGGGHGRGNAGAEQGAENESVAGSSESGLSDQVIDQEPPRQTCYVISPRNSWKIRWDIFCGVWIVYTIIVMTWRIGFDQAAKGGWLALDYSVDFLFAVDTVLCFRTGYFDLQDQLVTDSWEIARKYLLSYFLFDVLSWLPISLIVEGATGQSSTEMKSMKLMKFVRLVRLAKLTRLFKLRRFITLLEEKLDLKPAMIRMVKLIANIVFLAHLLACMWHFIALPACGNDEDEVDCTDAKYNMNATLCPGCYCPLPNCDWIDGSCKALPAIGPCPDSQRYDDANIVMKTNWIRESNTDQESNLVARYITSFYFVIATMMAVGYGDISGKNTEERVFCIILQLFGATSFGFILSSVTSVLESANPRIQEYNKRMHEIKEWMTGRHMPRKLKCAIREHWQYALAKRSIFNEADILGNMPCSMRMDIIQKCYADWLRKLARTFANEDLGLRIELVQLLQPQQVMHREIMLEEGEISYEVYIVLTGCLEALCDGNRKELGDQKKWVTMSLKRSRLGESAKKLKQLQDEADAEGASTDDVPLEVLCGIYSVSDMVGHAMACPMMVRGFANRTEVLVINKDALADVQSRFVGAIQRDDATEENLKSVMEQVLKSPLVTHHAFERPVKSQVLLNNAIAMAEELPAALVKGEFNSAPQIGKSLKELMPNESFAVATAADASAETDASSNDADNSSRSLHKLMPMKSSSTLSTGFMSMTTRVMGFESEDHDPFKKTVVYVFTRRLKEGSDEFEMGEETEEEIMARFIIPPSYRRKLYWDVLVGVLIIYSVLVIPLRISFDLEVAVLDIFDIFVDLIFFVDMVLNFRTGYMDSDGYLVTVPHLIRQKYMWTWFPIDFFSTFPVDRCVEAGVGSSSMGKQTRALKMIRMVRLIRLLKLARMLKMGKLAQKFEDMADLSPLALKCINLGGKLTIMSHFLGCFWFFVAAAPEDLENCKSPGDTPTGDPSICPWWMGKGIKIDSPTFKLEQYIAAVYWAFTTMTTVGYGDIAGGSPGERVYAIFAMIFGATVFGYIVGSIAAVAGQERGVEALTKKRISLVRNFCEEQSVSDNKVKEVLRHYRFFYQERSPYNEQNLFMELPNRLRKQVTKHVYREALQRIGLFVGPTMKGLETGPLPDWFASWVMRILEPQAVSMGEIVVNAEDSSIVGEVFFVYDGECEAFLQRSANRKKEPDKGAHSDTGGSMDSIDEATPTVGNTTSSSGKTKTLMIFSPGTVFGLEHMGSGTSQRYSVRCSKYGHCLLYVLRQSMLAEVQASCPEMVKALQKAIANLIFLQTKLRVPQKNLELRRQNQNQNQSQNQSKAS
eukprot:TRINITY_DN2966_c0_g2_i1.p1 TRINITY_DN2966_c0_g2~~TRINITY_DN2966_c0_g2_i1.p1  ORF type:complete len:1445 (-),score=322.48 TRINITY_DN2966_c0_g2_i1:97-4368(-)